LKKIAAIMIILFLCINNVYGEEKEPVYSIYINAASRTLKLFNNGELVKEYPVAVGKPTTKTPIGSFTIRNKVVNPYWNNKGNIVAPGPRNPLGIRWMGISAPRGTYGIHGNNVPSSIGTYASAGCVRMYNNDAAELYSLITVSAKVQISYDSIELKQDKYSSSNALIIYPDVYKQKNAEALLKNILSSNRNVSPEQAARALKLASGNIQNPIVVCDGTAVLLNNQYITNDAFVENNKIYIYYMAAIDYFGMDGEAVTELGIPVLERNKKVYINLSDVIAKIGGQQKIDAKNNNVYINASLVKVNGKYLCNYKGSFDKEYLLESSEMKQVGQIRLNNSQQSTNLKELCNSNSWKLAANSINKTIDIRIPLQVKIGEQYIKTEFYNGRYYIDSESAVGISNIQNQNLNLYVYKEKSYYDVSEIMEKNECQQDSYFTTIEVMGPLNNNV
jgi:hypothetical protein